MNASSARVASAERPIARASSARASSSEADGRVPRADGSRAGCGAAGSGWSVGAAAGTSLAASLPVWRR